MNMIDQYSRINGSSCIVLIILFMIGVPVRGYSQGGYNINDIPLSSLSDEVIGTEVRVDFKMLPPYDNPQFGRDFPWGIDTVDLVINGGTITFRENWRMYPDAFEMRDQTLQRVDKKYNEFFIGEMCLVAIGDSTLTLEVILYEGPKEKRKHSTHTLTINKSAIERILIKT